MHIEQELVVLDFIRPCLQLVDIPVGPDIFTLEKLGLGRCEPDAEMSWKFDWCKVISISLSLKKH